MTIPLLFPDRTRGTTVFDYILERFYLEVEEKQTQSVWALEFLVLGRADEGTVRLVGAGTRKGLVLERRWFFVTPKI